MTQISRRQALGLATAAVGMIATGTASARTTPAYAIARARYGRNADFILTKAKTVTMVPLTTIEIEEGNFSSLLPSGMVQINEKGLYRVLMGLDWKAQEETDTALRMYGLRRKAASDTSGPILSDERLVSFDHPGSDSPAVARAQVQLEAFNLSANGVATFDVAVSTKGAALTTGDIVRAAHAGATEAALGVQAFNLLSIEAKMVGANQARVIFFNRTATSLTVPAGTLNVLAQSATVFRGESEDAWNTLSTPLIEMSPGQRIYIAAKNQLIAGDYIQPGKTQTFLALEKFG